MFKICLYSLLVLSFSTALHASSKKKYNGYIVKLKGQSLSVPFVGTAVKIKKSYNTKFGNFALVSGPEVLVHSLSSSSDVEYVEPNWIITLNKKLDSGFGMQWGLNNLGTNTTGASAGKDIDILKAWNISNKEKKEIVVAVIDSGIDYRHPDLKDNIWVNEVEKNGMNMYDDDGNGYMDDIHGYNFVYDDGNPLDGNSHGTHIAGVIGAAHNGLGIMGIAPNVKLMGLKFVSDSGEGEMINAIAAVNYAIMNGAHIMSNSWGTDENSKALEEAITAAGDAGILFVASSGNSGKNNDMITHYPSNYTLENVISVGAMNARGERAYFSNYGINSVDIFAPGVDIFSTVKNGNYSLMSGTSMATPMVVGALALLMSQDENLTALEAKRRLLESTSDKKYFEKFSRAGSLNVFNLLRRP